MELYVSFGESPWCSLGTIEVESTYHIISIKQEVQRIKKINPPPSFIIGFIYLIRK